MKIERILNWETTFKTKFAHLYLGENDNILRILDSPSSGERGSSQNFALKDVEYTIVENVLYIKGTRIEYYHLIQVLEEINTLSLRSVYVIWNDERNQQLEEPLVPTNIVIKRWWRNNMKFKGIEFPYNQEPYWFKIKEEKPIEMAISSFILREK